MDGQGTPTTSSRAAEEQQHSVDADANADVECNICYNPAERNRRCQHCRHLFCLTCIQQWLNTATTPTCPMCRWTVDAATFAHDATVERLVAQQETTCDICGDAVPFKTLAKHRLMCMHETISCPYKGCHFRASRANMDMHTATCSHAASYNYEEVIQQVCARAAADEQQYVNEHLLDDIYKPDECLEGEDSILHYVQTHDTLSGLAVKYGCTREELKRLNNLSHDTQLFARNTIVVPRPPTWQPKEEPDVPLAVLVALRKKRLTRRVAQQCRITEAEAITYLHLTHYKPDKAIQRCEDDQLWTLQHGETQPKTMKEFFARMHRGLAACSACSRPLLQDTPREHCASCGVFFCHVCHHGQGLCKETLPKFALGVTNPETCNDRVRVCSKCHLRRSSCPPLTSRRITRS